MSLRDPKVTQYGRSGFFFFLRSSKNQIVASIAIGPPKECPVNITCFSLFTPENNPLRLSNTWEWFTTIINCFSTVSVLSNTWKAIAFCAQFWVSEGVLEPPIDGSQKLCCPFHGCSAVLIHEGVKRWFIYGRCEVPWVASEINEAWPSSTSQKKNKGNKIKNTIKTIAPNISIHATSAYWPQNG